ncbi:proton-conducting transporter membrane subunit [Lutibaculum baratangense]|uniref:NADH-ubiquinone oxidoreductase chain L n=1 Tax=Lutibaculum baratangense AMV1 TaxID=631454 RepID=V4TE80_9HYPH|nr:proton-conducting transporter membrane subunit [Lutibaculum baratangense]ESR24518.1 NADH-ubiquinone oxidoreductase chain L [Lutibaculum baratangense AMV1]
MSGIMPALLMLCPLVPAVLTFFLREDSHRLRNAVAIGSALLKLALIAVVLLGVAAGNEYELRIPLVPGLYMLLRVDELSLLFITLSSFLWLVTTVYAIAYLGGHENLSRFFGFFNLCVAATTGIALSGSLVTFFFFYELLTLSTWPLVVHNGDEKSLSAGRTYLAYTMGGSAALLLGIVWAEGVAGPVEFIAPLDFEDTGTLAQRLIFVLCVGGMGVKAALIPLHGWLPTAMVAPAPVSALLHAVAVVKAGAFGIIRFIHDVYGIARVEELALGLPLALIASATIIYGSVRALQQTDIKRRLAFSTVSQVSYIVLGASLAGPIAAIGGLVHLVHQGLMKVTLFFAAGALAERIEVRSVDQLDGAGRRMPLTMVAFSLAALGMIGVPPLAGFMSKWFIGVGALEAGRGWVILVLAGSSLLNAAYFLPLIYRAWFKPAPEGAVSAGAERPLALILPAVVTAISVLGAGVLAGLWISPLGWATLIVEREYLP